MSKRRTGRKLAMQLLYQFDIKQINISEIIKDLNENRSYEVETKSWATELASGTLKMIDISDGIISKYSESWDINRVNKIDKSILRLALFEITKTETDNKIILNEYLEIAKKYSTEDSYKFINGILGAYVNDQCLQG
ncbi:transcription antitermination factor NusB [Candidatus Marinamargulisbacteria bacterium SCGC AG-410-N11]|nr:transcription antitermination factor NusB [Candidatus Marinamargulisbacteria bacterium SCGC AG-410-N11]